MHLRISAHGGVDDMDLTGRLPRIYSPTNHSARSIPEISPHPISHCRRLLLVIRVDVTVVAAATAMGHR